MPEQPPRPVPEPPPGPVPEPPADPGQAADDRPTMFLPPVLPDLPLPPLQSVPPGAVAPRRALNRRLAVSAAVAVALVLVAVPVLVLQSGSSPSPAQVAAPASTGPPAARSSTAVEPEPTAPARDPAARAMAPSASEPAAVAPPAATGAPPAPTTTTEPPGAGVWSTIVDNTTAGRFTASGNWGTSTDSGQRYGSDFRYASPVEASDPAWYRVDIPATGRYRVEVWFPAKSGYNERAPYIVATTAGNQTVHISQQSGGGRWVSLGTFELAAGDADVVAVSRWRTAGTGYIVADAVRITRA